jgi:hypothetical protein
MSPRRCPGCGRPMPPRARTGRPRHWCSDACRRRAGYLAWKARCPPQSPWTDEDSERAAAGLLLAARYPVALAVFTGFGVLGLAVPFWDKVIE